MEGNVSVLAEVQAPARLTAVQATGLLDTIPEESFDRLARLASMLLEAPSAFVTIVDERRSFWKSCVGAATALGVRENPVEESFCQYVVASGRELVVGDAANDPRTKDNPSVASMGVAAWAGYPVHAPDGQVLGSFCVVDGVVREWTDRDRRVLETLAASASAEVALRVSATRTEELLAVSRRSNRRHRLLSEAVAALHRDLDPTAELRALARAVIPELADVATIHVLLEPVRPGVQPALPVLTERVAAETVPAIEAPVAGSARLRWRAGEPIPEAVARGRLFAYPVSGVADWARRNAPMRTFDTEVRHFAQAPVIAGGLVVAVALFGRCDSRPWALEDLTLLEEISRLAGVALNNGLSHQRTRETSLTLQRCLLADPPAVEGMQIAARYRPAGRDEVGGDWHDLFRLGPDRVAFAVGDVVGHDIAAAAAMGQLRAMLRTLGTDPDVEPGQVLDRLAAVNRLLQATTFATALFGRLTRERDRWSLRFASAGHLPPMLAHPDGTVAVLEDANAMALTTLTQHDPPRPTAALELMPGSTLLAYTDGLVERRGVDLGESIEGLAHRLGKLVGVPLEELCDRLVADAPSCDDLAVLAIRLDGPPRSDAAYASGTSATG